MSNSSSSQAEKIDKKQNQTEHNNDAQAEPETKTTVDQEEVERFARLAAEWWNPNSKFRPLHKFNPVRLSYIKEKLCQAFDRDPKAARPLEGIRIMDIGCGGGLLSEPLARLGGDVVGVDAAKANIKVAKLHAQQSGVEVDYRADTVENLVAQGEKFDAVLNMEVVEHVADVPLFMQATAEAVKPNGLMFVATLNRTLKSWALAIIGAEYILHWLPKGTHDYKKFPRPEELKTLLQKGGLTTIDEKGVVYNPLRDSWNLSQDMSVNYMLLARRL